jgi:hypothetical protein
MLTPKIIAVKRFQARFPDVSATPSTSHVFRFQPAGTCPVINPTDVVTVSAETREKGLIITRNDECNP